MVTALGNADSDIYNVIASVPSTVLNVIVALLPADVDADSADLVAELNSLKNASVKKLGPILVSIAKLFELELNQMRIPSIMDLNTLIEIFTNKTGMLGLNTVLNVFAAIDGSLLNVVTLVPDTLLSTLVDLRSTSNQVDIDDLMDVLRNGVFDNLGSILVSVYEQFGVSMTLDDIPSSIAKWVTYESAVMKRIEGAYGEIDINVVLALFGSAFDFLLNFNSD